MPFSFDSLGVFSVNCPVHADRGLQVVQLPVGADTIGDGRQGGGAETGGARGDGVAAHPHDASVHLVPVQPQPGQDAFGVFQTVFLPERKVGKQNFGWEAKIPAAAAAAFEMGETRTRNLFQKSILTPRCPR